MKALILAAGRGKRLYPLTDNLPKALVDVGGIPLLIRTLNMLGQIGIREIGIVVGYRGDDIRKAVGNKWGTIPVRYYENTRYETTNNVVSFCMAAGFCDDEMLLLECDVCCRRDVLLKMKESSADCLILASPYDPARMNGTAVRITNGDRVEELIVGSRQGKSFDYGKVLKTVNIYRFSKRFLSKYIPLLQWYTRTMGENCFYEKVLGALIYLQECDVRVLKTDKDTWCEIDDMQDLEHALAMLECEHGA